ncbi:CD63 antigen [Amyelois transitella]|uniref:CD63 antigen n=1 Tax=Amyelois transitella TaxID=680683 RepID=UPI00067DBC89|nr:CD63 antigen [Amyelois transitella]XP_060800434.1 CD63 antigen [Amyelois transitella]
MALSCGMSCVKYLLFLFNLLFAATGLFILIVGIRAEIKAAPYVDLTDENFYTSGPIVLIIVGVIVFIVAFFGCCGAVKENHCMIVTFSVFLLLIFVAEVAVGITGYVKHKDLAVNLERRLNETIAEYPNNPNVRETFDIIQTDLQCCGVRGPEDWHNATLPGSCCSALDFKEDGVLSDCTVNAPAVHKDGCLAVIKENLETIALLLGATGLGIAIVQLLGVIFACCLARSIRSQYETV